jgi:O-antigen/teichoic acid export membrane protein
LSTKKNVVANFLGQGCKAITGIAFIPLYIKYLGIEAYGLIGIFAILQSSLAILDLGMRPALGREMARFTAGAHDSQSIRELLRSVEIVGICIAIVIATTVWLASGWLTSDWLVTKSLSDDVVRSAFTAMGVLVALRFIENIYLSSIIGLQRQVIESTVSCSMAAIRGLGAVCVLAFFSPTLKAFFVWQGLVSACTILVLGRVVYRTLPRSPRPVHFSWHAITSIWRFAAGIMAISLLALALTQIDKVLLSRLLALTVFAYYALAGTLTSALYMLTAPVNSAFYPQFTELITRGSTDALRRAYHQASQLITVVMGSAALVLIVFADVVLRVWTRNPALADHVTPLLRVLALGTLLNGLMGVPYQMQLAHGWTSLTVKINLAAVALLVPAIFFVARTYGAIGAAWIWVILNVGYLIVDIHFMHRRILRSEKWRWYWGDVVLPLCTSATSALLIRVCLPVEASAVAEFGALAVAAVVLPLSGAAVCPLIRANLLNTLGVAARSTRSWLKI